MPHLVYDCQIFAGNLVYSAGGQDSRFGVLRLHPKQAPGDRGGAVEGIRYGAYDVHRMETERPPKCEAGSNVVEHRSLAIRTARAAITAILNDTALTRESLTHMVVNLRPDHDIDHA